MFYMPQIRKFVRDNFRSIFIFLLVGALSAVVYFSVFALLWKNVFADYSIAVSMGYIASIVFYFFAHRHVTFKSHQHPASPQVARFLFMVILNYFITLLVVRFVVELMGLPPYCGIVASIGATTILSYFIAKFWVFRTPVQN